MVRVSFHELTEREMNAAALYYEGENLGLGVRFLDELGAVHFLDHQESERRGQDSWRGSQTHPSQISMWNPLLGEGRRHSNSRNHEPAAETELLGTPVLKVCRRSSGWSGQAKQRVAVCNHRHRRPLSRNPLARPGK